MDPLPGDGSTTDLDLTNAHLPSLDGVPLPATLTDVDLTANRLKALDARVLALPRELDKEAVGLVFLDRGWEQSRSQQKIKTARPFFFSIPRPAPPVCAPKPGDRRGPAGDGGQCGR
jgi:hypothetical protein